MYLLQIKKSNLVFIIILLTVIFIYSCSENTPIDSANNKIDSLQIYREIFSTPEKCAGCHPNHYAEWKTSMHAYAMTDPVFLKLNETGQARSGNQLDQFCVKCHSPIGSLLQETPPDFNPADLSGLAAHAIHCDVCHTVSSVNRGHGIASFRLDRVRQGSIENPVENSFHQSVYDSRYQKSAFCSGCHDIIAPNGLMVETTSSEWDASAYSAMGLECQNCHMPAYQGKAATGGPERAEVHRHYFTGVDYPLVDFPGKDSTIARVDKLLKNAVDLSVNLPAAVNHTEEFNIQVLINNSKTGHNIPSGSIFERQMWIEFIVINQASGDTLFSSGLPDKNLDLKNHHSSFVQNGTLEADTALILFNGIPKKNGIEILFFWEADEIDNRTIPAFQTYTANYKLQAPQMPAALDVTVRLLFRSFPPYVLRELQLDNLLNELLIFEMNTFSATIQVN